MAEQIIPATEARVRFGEVLRRAVEFGERFIVERAGEQQVVILSIADYQQLIAAQTGEPTWRALAMATRARIQAELQGTILEDPAEVISKVRSERDEQLDLP